MTDHRTSDSHSHGPRSRNARNLADGRRDEGAFDGVFGLPAGTLAFSRVVSDATDALTAVLDRRHTGYAVLTPSDALVLDDGTPAVLVTRDGIPTHVLADEARGAGALAAAATPGPLRVQLHETGQPLATDTVAVLDSDARVAPETPARRLAGDDALAERTLAAAPEDSPTAEPSADSESSSDLDAVEAFLADEDAIERLQSQAREEAERRAREWGFDEHVDD